MPGDLRQARMPGRRRPVLPFASGLVHAAGPDHQHLLRAQVHGRRDRRRLPHRAVAEPLDRAAQVERLGREDERDGRRRDQVLDRQPRDARGDALGAHPGLPLLVGLIEGDVVARGVAGPGHGQRVDVALGQHVVQSIHLDPLGEQAAQRRVVEQAARARAAPAVQRPAQRHHRQPLRAGADHSQRIGGIDLVDVDVLPDVHQPVDRGAEVVGLAGQRGSVDRAGGSAGNHLEGVVAGGAGVAPELRDGREHADLIGRASPPSGKDEACPGLGILHGRQLTPAVRN